jgi:hypothetical protein
MNLNKIMNAMSDPNFVRCHRSYAINIHHVHSFDHHAFYVMNGDDVLSIHSLWYITSSSGVSQTQK